VFKRVRTIADLYHWNVIIPKINTTKQVHIAIHIAKVSLSSFATDEGSRKKKDMNHGPHLNMHILVDVKGIHCVERSV